MWPSTSCELLRCVILQYSGDSGVESARVRPAQGALLHVQGGETKKMLQMSFSDVVEYNCDSPTMGQLMTYLTVVRNPSKSTPPDCMFRYALVCPCCPRPEPAQRYVVDAAGIYGLEAPLAVRIVSWRPAARDQPLASSLRASGRILQSGKYEMGNPQR